MTRPLKRPRNPLLRLLPWILAALAATGGYLYVRALDVEPRDLGEVLAAVRMSSAYTEAEERSWLAEAFPPSYLAAPVSDLPCPTSLRAASPLSTRISEALSWVREGRLDDAVERLAELDSEYPSNWVPGLVLGMVLAREGRFTEARSTLAAHYRRPSIQSTVRRAVDQASRSRPTSRPSKEDVLGAIHLLHAYSYVQIETHSGGDELWDVLRSPIGCSKLLALRGETDRGRRLPTWAEHRLQAPGCGLTEHSLTTLDLYNNLIVGYLEHPDFQETSARRQKELRRNYNDPAHENPLLAVMRTVAEDFPSERFPAEREHWLWAVSNAERLLKHRRESSSGQLGNVRLAYNLAALMESALADSPVDAHGPLGRQKDALLVVAFAGRRSVLPRQLQDLNRGLARLGLFQAVRSGTLTAFPEDLVADLDARQAEVHRAVRFALDQRRGNPSWLAQVSSPGEAIRQALGQRTGPWLEASRRDFSATLAREAAGAPEDQRPWWGRWARKVLETGDEKPAELRALEKELGFWWRLAPHRFLTSPFMAAVLAVLLGLMTWIVTTWLVVQLGVRRDLVTSFYRLEARAQLRRDR